MLQICLINYQEMCNGITITDQNYVPKDVKGRLNFEIIRIKFYIFPFPNPKS